MISFLALGDWGETTSLQESNARSIQSYEFKVDAVLALGDNFYDHGVESVSDPQWKTTYEEAFRPVCPWLAVLGNHDYLLNPQAQIDYTAVSNTWTMPARYYDKVFSNDQNSVHLFFLDTFELSERESRVNTLAMNHENLHQWYQMASHFHPDKQLQWLEHGLQNSKATWKMVIGHYPIFSPGPHGNNLELIRTLLPLLQQHRVDVYLAGHDHILSHQNYGLETQFILSGTGSRVAHPSLPTGIAYFRFFYQFLEFGFLDTQGKPFYTRILVPNSRHPVLIKNS